MADTTPHLEFLLGTRQDWTPIAILFPDAQWDASPLLDLARERRWQLVNLSKFDGNVPSNLDLRGAIITTLPGSGTAVALQQGGVPIVRIGRWPHPDDPQMPAVIPDQAAAGRIAAEHFAERDFKHVACIGQQPWGDNEVIYKAFKARANELGMHCHLLRRKDMRVKQFASELDFVSYRKEEFTVWLRGLPRPIGLLAFADILADRFCQWVVEAGLSVPTDVAILSIGDDRLICEGATVPISSIAHDMRGRIAKAVETLAGLMSGQPLQQTTIMIPPLGVVARQSTDVLAVADPLVVQALQYMWDHVTTNLSVDQVVNAVGASRRTLERAFHLELGRGINQEFQRRRLEKARELLLQTDMRIAQIADALNFSGSRHFCTAFAAAYGDSPARYRKLQRDNR